MLEVLLNNLEDNRQAIKAYKLFVMFVLLIFTPLYATTLIAKKSIHVRAFEKRRHFLSVLYIFYSKEHRHLIHLTTNIANVLTISTNTHKMSRFFNTLNTCTSCCLLRR